MVGGFGSGKSRPLLMEAIFHCLEYPGAEAIILRKTIPDLKRTVISKFLADVPRELYQRFNEGDHIVWFHPHPKFDENGNQLFKPDGTPETVQSKLYFAACEREKDVGKYLSTEYVFIGFEELGEFPFGVWSALADRNRCPIPGSRPCMAGATNPFGVGWAWIKKLWVQGKTVEGMDADLFDPADYEYFHSTVLDNPIYSNDAEYVRRLMMSPNRAVVYEGKLDQVSGLYFENYDADAIEREESDFIFQNWQPVWVGWDYGFSHYATMIFMTKALLKGEKPRMVNVVLKEVILQEKTPENQANSLILAIPRNVDRETNEELGYRWNVDSVHLSWERFNKTQSQRTIADEIGDILAEAGLPRPVRSNTDRVAGWTKIYSLMEAGLFYVIKDKAPTLCEAIPQLPRDKKNIEDVEKPAGVSLYDDLGDALRYAIAGTLLDAEDDPKEVKFEKELAKIHDPMARFARQYQEHNRQKQASRPNVKPGNIIPSWRSRVKPR